MGADLVLTNARIYTVDAKDTILDSMAIARGRIMAAGTAPDVEPLVGPGSRVVNAGGLTIVPGFNDAHLHLLSFGQSLRSVNIEGVATIEEAVDRVAAAVRVAPAGTWISGVGWDRNLFGRLPTRHELDAVASRNPVFLASKDLHSLWVNSLALQQAGIGAGTSDPADGEIVREEGSREPSGVLREGARSPVFEAVPPPSEQEAQHDITVALAEAARKGLTSLQTFESADTFRAAQALRARGALPLRLCCHLWKSSLGEATSLGLRTGFGDERLRLGHLKLFLDGALGSQTALMLDPYSGSDNRGIQTMSREEFKDLLLRAAASGIAVAVHAIGDAANRIAIDVFEETVDVWRPAGLRPRIEHVQLLAPGDGERLGRLGVIASMQPIHATSDWRVADRHWGARSSLAYAWRTVLASGAPLAFGSDCPVERIDPLEGMYAAVARRTPVGEPTAGWYPEQRLAPSEALRAYTLGAAFASGEEALKGSLEPGKLADFTVLSGDPITGPPALFLNTTVHATVVGGQVVYGEL